MKPRLPDGYRAYIGAAPLLAVSAPAQRPDVAVRQWDSPSPANDGQSGGTAAHRPLDIEPDDVEVAVAAIDPGTLLFVESHIAAELQIQQPPVTPPLAVSYRVGEPAAAGGRILAIWRRPLEVGEPLPVVRLPLDIDSAVAVEMEQTYSRAAADAYVE